jgi:hypothetical protein
MYLGVMKPAQPAHIKMITVVWVMGLYLLLSTNLASSSDKKSFLFGFSGQITNLVMFGPLELLLSERLFTLLLFRSPSHGNSESDFFLKALHD